MLYYISNSIFTILLRILFRIHVFGKENLPKPPFIVASNHASLLDPPLVGMVCRKYPVDFMAKRELFDTPVIGIWARNVRCIEARRGENSVRSLKEAIRRIRKGHVIGLFPEGTRSTSGDLQNAMRGTGFLIAKAGVPVIPIYIGGSGEAFPKGRGINIGAHIDVVIGKPALPDTFLSKKVSGKENYEMIANMVMKWISELKEAKNIATFSKKR